MLTCHTTFNTQRKREHKKEAERGNSAAHTATRGHRL